MEVPKKKRKHGSVAERKEKREEKKKMTQLKPRPKWNEKLFNINNCHI